MELVTISSQGQITIPKKLRELIKTKFFMIKIGQEKQTIQISNQDLAVGKLPLISYIRYNKIITVNTQIVTKKVAKLNRTKLAELKNNLISFLEQEIN